MFRKKLIVLSATALAAIAFPAFAQTAGNVDPMPPFEILDADGNKSVSRMEFTASGRFSVRNFIEADINNDERISAGELDTFGMRLRHSASPTGGAGIQADGNAGLSFGALDADRNNSVSEAEFRANNTLTEEQFGQIDTDSDGQISITEMNAYRTSLRSHDGGIGGTGIAGDGTGNNALGVTGAVNTGVAGTRTNSGVAGTINSGVGTNAGVRSNDVNRSPSAPNPSNTGPVNPPRGTGPLGNTAGNLPLATPSAGPNTNTGSSGSAGGTAGGSANTGGGNGASSSSGGSSGGGM